MKNSLSKSHQYNQKSFFDQTNTYAQSKGFVQNGNSNKSKSSGSKGSDPCKNPRGSEGLGRNEKLGLNRTLIGKINLAYYKSHTDFDHIKTSNLNSKSDSDLHQNLMSLVSQEREIVTEVIHHLAEVQRRHLYSDFKCTSLWDYATTQLGYSAGEAHVRISAMRLIEEVPEVEASLENGELSLTSIAQAQTFIRREQKSNNTKLPKIEKKKLINSLKGCSTREIKKILIGKSKSPHIHRETQKQIEDDRLELKFSISAGVQKKLSRIKGRLAHKNLPTQEALFEALLDLALSHTEPKPVSKNALAKSKAKILANQIGTDKNPHGDFNNVVHLNNEEAKEGAHEKDTGIATEVNVECSNLSRQAVQAAQTVQTVQTNMPLQATQVKTRHIPAAIRNHVLIRDGQKCVNCGSEHALQIDHKRPFRLNGSHGPENLQVLCRSCNLRKEKVPVNRR